MLWRSGRCPTTMASVTLRNEGAAEALGFGHDGTVERLVRGAMAH